MNKAFAVIAIAGLTGSAMAQTDYFGGGGAIPDNGGASNNPLSSTIIVGDSGSIADINVTLNGMSHTWVGDLIVTLSHGATTVVLVDRPGVPASTFGYSWDLGGDYTFDDSAANGTWDSIGTGGVSPLASGSYQSENPLAAFNGQELSGAWTLSISDNAAADTGSLQGWTLTATVPTPSSMALLGLGGLVAGRRRR